MELLPDGKMVLDEQDTVGVLALIYAKTRMVVDIHATTDSSLSTCHADPPRTRARAYAESNPLADFALGVCSISAPKQRSDATRSIE